MPVRECIDTKRLNVTKAAEIVLSGTVYKKLANLHTIRSEAVNRCSGRCNIRQLMIVHEQLVSRLRPKSNWCKSSPTAKALAARERNLVSRDDLISTTSKQESELAGVYHTYLAEQ